MKEQVKEELKLIEEKLAKGTQLSENDLLKILTLKLIATKNEQ